MPNARAELEHILSRPWLHASGKQVPVIAAAIDSGGHYTQHVYAFASKHKARSWYAIRGNGGEGKPIWTKSKQKLGRGKELYLVGVDDAKSTIYKRYGNQEPGPGYIHLPMSMTPEQVKQLTVERSEIDYEKGFPKKTWTKERHDRNEMLDMAVYAYAAFCSKDLDVGYLLKQLNNDGAETDLDPFKVGEMFR